MLLSFKECCGLFYVSRILLYYFSSISFSYKIESFTNKLLSVLSFSKSFVIFFRNESLLLIILGLLVLFFAVRELLMILYSVSTAAPLSNLLFYDG